MATKKELNAALLGPVVNALLQIYKDAKSTQLSVSAESALSEALQLLLIPPELIKTAEAKISIAKAVGILNADLVLTKPKRTPAKKAPVAKKTIAVVGQTTLSPPVPWPFAARKKRVA